MPFTLRAERALDDPAKQSIAYGPVPLVIRMVVGRGWGQGAQHSQSLQAWFAHVPGLKVVMPSSPYDAKGLMKSAIREDNPVFFVQHKRLGRVREDVPEGEDGAL